MIKQDLSNEEVWSIFIDRVNEGILNVAGVARYLNVHKISFWRKVSGVTKKKLNSEQFDRLREIL